MMVAKAHQHGPRSYGVRVHSGLALKHPDLMSYTDRRFKTLQAAESLAARLTRQYGPQESPAND